MSRGLERVGRSPGPDERSARPPRSPAQHPLLALGAGNQAVTQMVARLVKDRKQSHPVLRMNTGSKGDVTLLQTRLNEDGASLTVSGLFDQETKAAVIAFQGRHGLKPDGIVGIRTWGALDELERRGIAGPEPTVIDDESPVSQAEHDDVEAILHPGHSGGLPGPAMTDFDPGGAY